jgi:hypothetical protein
MKKLRTIEVQGILASIQMSIFSSHLLSNNVKIKVYMTTVFFFIASGVGLSPLHCGHFWPIVPAPDDR